MGRIILLTLFLTANISTWVVVYDMALTTNEYHTQFVSKLKNNPAELAQSHYRLNRCEAWFEVYIARIRNDEVARKEVYGELRRRYCTEKKKKCIVTAPQLNEFFIDKFIMCLDGEDV